MNILSRDKQIEIIAALSEGMSIRSVERLTGVHRDTIMRLGARVGRGCAELHDRMMVGLRVPRLECDELWQYVGCKQKNVTRANVAVRGDQYTFIALASSAKAIVAYRTGKRDSENTDLFIRDLRERLLGTPEISTDGFHPYRPAIRDAFGERVAHGVINKTYAVSDLRKDAAHRYSPAAVVAVAREAVIGEPTDISTSYAERSNLSLRMASRRFTRLTNAFSKKLDNHAAAVSLYVAHYNLCRVHEALSPNARNQATPAMALGLTDHAWSIGELLDAALAVATPDPTETAPDRRRRFRVIAGGKK
ncbi:MAG: transposase [Xanthobacteraceae bacterium]